MKNNAGAEKTNETTGGSSRGKIHWAFFGSSHFSVLVLNKLEVLGPLPNLVVTTPDKPRGRGLEITSGEVRVWAEQRNIPVFAPATLKTGEVFEELKTLGANSGTDSWDVFLVASYGKIVPKNILDMPRTGTLNIHPSLLPKFRGPTPLESAILSEEETETGVTIMKIDEAVDHGPIVDQVVVPISDWPPYYADLENLLAEEGAALFAEILPEWLTGTIAAQEQEHALATFTKKFEKSESQINLTETPEKNLRKIRAFSGKNSAFYIEEKTGKRVIVARAKIASGVLLLERVKPEGKNEMGFEDYKRGLRD